MGDDETRKETEEKSVEQADGTKVEESRTVEEPAQEDKKE